MIFPHGVGIDIKDTSIRIAWLSHKGVIHGLHEVALPSGLIVDDRIAKKELLKNHISDILTAPELEGLKGNVTLVIPESRVFSATFFLDGSLRGDQLHASAREMGQTFIPLPLKDGFVDCEFGKNEDGKIKTSMYAVEKEFIRDLEDVFELLELPVIAQESKSRALLQAQSTFVEHEEGNTVFIEIGEMWMNITGYDDTDVLMFSKATPLRKYLDESGNLSSANMQVVCDIISQTINYFKNKQGFSVHVYFTGDSTGVESIMATCGSSLENIILHNLSKEIQVTNKSSNNLQTFCAAIGAALRSIKPRTYHSIHNFKERLVYEGEK